MAKKSMNVYVGNNATKRYNKMRTARYPPKLNLRRRLLILQTLLRRLLTRM